MRKRIILFLIIIAFTCGFIKEFKKIKENTKNIDEEETENKEIVTEIYRDELNLSIAEVDTLNPLKTQNNGVAAILSLVYEPLINYKSDEEIECVLLQSYAKTDASTWILKLKDGVKWHTAGETLKSNDVIFTFNLLKNNNLTYSSNVENISTVEKIDDGAIKVTLNSPDDFFITKLNFPILPEYYFKGDNFNNETKAEKMVGTGPYKYSQTNSDGSIELLFNKSWWNGEEAKLNKITVYKYSTYGEAVKAFKSAEVDMIVTNMTSWKEKFGTIGMNSYSFENTEYEAIVPNCQNVVLSESSVRRAILQAINRENIINSVYNENATISDIPIHTNSKNSITNAEYNIEKAKQILINAGWEQTETFWHKEINGKDYKLNFTLMVNKDSEKKVLVAEKVKEDLAEIGINITIAKTTLENLKNSIEQDKFELILTSLDIKNETIPIETVSKDSKINYANYSSDTMQKIIEKLKIDEENYKENMPAFGILYKSEAPYIGLYFKNNTILTNKSVKGNFEPTWSNYFRNIISFCK